MLQDQIKEKLQTTNKQDQCLPYKWDWEYGQLTPCENQLNQNHREIKSENSKKEEDRILASLDDEEDWRVTKKDKTDRQVSLRFEQYAKELVSFISDDIRLQHRSIILKSDVEKELETLQSTSCLSRLFCSGKIKKKLKELENQTECLGGDVMKKVTQFDWEYKRKMIHKSLKDRIKGRRLQKVLTAKSEDLNDKPQLRKKFDGRGNLTEEKYLKAEASMTKTGKQEQGVFPLFELIIMITLVNSAHIPSNQQEAKNDETEQTEEKTNLILELPDCNQNFSFFSTDKGSSLSTISTSISFGQF